MPVYDEKYINAKVREFNGVIKTNVLGDEIPKESMHHVCIACITIDSYIYIYEALTNLFLQVYSLFNILYILYIYYIYICKYIYIYTCLYVYIIVDSIIVYITFNGIYIVYAIIHIYIYYIYYIYYINYIYYT